jgi:RNA polymerase sigma-70 factor, ECF subfamily
MLALTHTDESDEALFLAWRDDRDVEAFARLYDRYEVSLVTFAARMLGKTAPADDVLQETWIRAMQHARDWKPDAPLRAWLYRIARNLCLDALRARGVPLEVEDEPGAELSLAGPAPTYPTSDPLFIEMMERAVQTLSPAQREVVLLRVEGLSFAEIARVTQVGANTLKSRMNQARRLIERHLKGHGYDGHRG